MTPEEAAKHLLQQKANCGHNDEKAHPDWLCTGACVFCGETKADFAKRKEAAAAMPAPQSNLYGQAIPWITPFVDPTIHLIKRDKNGFDIYEYRPIPNVSECVMGHPPNAITRVETRQGRVKCCRSCAATWLEWRV
jgi:hypothetical protein